MSRRPTLPGVDEKALARIRKNPATVIPRHIGILHLPRGGRWFTRGMPGPEGLTGFPEGNVRGIRLEVWDEDGSKEWQQRWDRLEQGPVFEKM